MGGSWPARQASPLLDRIARTQEFVDRTRRLIHASLTPEFDQVVKALSLLQELQAVDPAGARPEWVPALLLMDSALDDLLKAVDRRAREDAVPGFLEKLTVPGPSR